MPSMVVMPPEPDAAYTPATLVGRVRLHAADTDIANAVFSDAEIAYFLLIGQNDPCLAASFALEALAVDKARVSNAIKIGRYTEDEKTVVTNLAARAQTLRELSNASAPMDAPDRVFSTDHNNGATLGSMSNW